MSLELRITVGDGEGGSDEHVYTSDDGLLAGRRLISEVMEGDEIKLGDLTLEIGGTFLGAEHRGELPPPLIPGRGQGGYRAVLKRDVGEGLVTVLDGLIPLVKIAHDVQVGGWSFPLLSASQEDFWARIKAVVLDTLDAEHYDDVGGSDVPFFFPRRDAGLGGASERWLHSELHLGYNPLGIVAARAYDWLELVEAVAAQASEADTGSVTLGAFPELTFSVRYRDGDGVNQTITRPYSPLLLSMGLWKGGAISRTNPTLPAWTGKELVEALISYTGWRLRTAYAAYPSTEISATFLSDAWPDPDPETLDALDDAGDDSRIAAGSYTRRAEASSTEGFGVRLKNPLRPTTPSVRQPARHPLLIVGETVADEDYVLGPGALPAPPPTAAVLALDEWAFEAAKPGKSAGDEEAEPSAKDVREVLVSLPSVGAERAVRGELEPGPVAPEFVEDLVQPDADDHPDYFEGLLYGLPALEEGDTAAYVVTVVDVEIEEETVPRVLYARRPEPVGVGSGTITGEFDLIHETWAHRLFYLRGFSRSEREVADGDFYVHDREDDFGFVVGDPASGLALEDEAWCVTSRQVDQADDGAALVLERPTGTLPRPAVPPTTGRVLGLTARLDRTQQFDLLGNEVYRAYILTFSWSPPAEVQASLVRYELEWRLEGDPWGTNDVVTTWATAHWIVSPVLEERYRVRVRAFGEVAGAWAEVKYSTFDDDLANQGL